MIARTPRLVCAYRVARYKVTRHAGLHGLCAGPIVSETRHSDTPRDAGVPHAVCHRQIEAAVHSDSARPRVDRDVRGEVRLQERVEETPEGTAVRETRTVDACVQSRGTRVTRGSLHAADRLPTCRPAFGTSASHHLALRGSRLATCSARWPGCSQDGQRGVDSQPPRRESFALPS